MHYRKSSAIHNLLIDYNIFYSLLIYNNEYSLNFKHIIKLLINVKIFLKIINYYRLNMFYLICSTKVILEQLVKLTI